MNGNCHFIFGATIGIICAFNMNHISNILPNIVNSPETQTIFVLGGCLGGIFPDIDNPSSYIGQLLRPFSTWISKINKIFGKVGSNHRGILHDPFVYLLGLVLSYMFYPAVIGIFIGCLSHTFLDMFNPKGVPFLFVSHIHLGNFKSGETASKVFTVICIVICAAASIILNKIF